MSTDQLQWARDALSQREDQLRCEVQAARDATRERQARSAHEVSDRKDDAEARIEAAVDDEGVERDLQELRQIEAARRRLDEGSYGRCIDCGESIGWERLRAQPAASRCIGCQRQAELARPRHAE